MAEDASKPVDSTEIPEADASNGVAPRTPSAKDKNTKASTKKRGQHRTPKSKPVLSYFPQAGELVEIGQVQQEPLLGDGDCSYIIVEEKNIENDNFLVIAPRELIKMGPNPGLCPGRYLTVASASGWAVVRSDNSQSSSTTTKVSPFRMHKAGQEPVADEEAGSARPIQLYESAHLYLAWVMVRYGLEECNTVIKREEEQKKTTDAIEQQAEGPLAVPTTKLSQQMDKEFHKSMFKSLRQLLTSAARCQDRNIKDMYILSFEQLLRRVKAFLPKLLTRKSPQRMKEAYEDVVDALNALWKHCGLQSLVEEAAEEEDEAIPGEEAAVLKDEINYETFIKLSVNERLAKIEAFDETPVLTGFDEEAEELEALPPPPNDVPPIPNVTSSEQHAEFINRIIDEMNGNEIGGLRHSCNVFDVHALLRRLAVHFCTKQGCCNPCSVTSEMFAGGKTQLGKTAVKFVTALAACEAGLVPIVITPGSANTRELAMKFIRFTGNDLESQQAFPRVVTLGKLGNDANELQRKEKLRLLEEEVFALDRSPVRKTIIVLNYNFRHLEVTRLFRDDTKGNHRSLVVILDEADEIFKSTEGEYEKMFKQEQELLKLLGRWRDFNGVIEPTVAHASPRLLMHVSATLLPCLVEYCYRDWNRSTASAGSSLKAEDFILLDPEMNKNYVGAKDFQAFESSHPLCIGDLKPSNVYMNVTMEEFYKKALADPDRETFVVDFTSARVTTDGGMHEKITRLSEQYNFLGICQSGAGIDVFDARDEDMLSVEPRRSDKKKLDEVIDSLTEDAVQCPIVFMAGSLVYRGVSVRGTKRVPTHIVVCLGRTQPIDKVIQAVGRATGLFQKNLRVLNLGQESPKVQVLIPKEDVEQIIVYNAVLDTFCDSLNRDAKNKQSLWTKLREVLEKVWKPEVMTRPIGLKKRNNLLRLATMFPDVCVQKIPTKAALEGRTIGELRQLAKRCFVDVEEYEDLPRNYRKRSIIEALFGVEELRKKNPDDTDNYDLPLIYPTPPSTISTSEYEQVHINPRRLEFEEAANLREAEPDIPKIAGEDIRDNADDDGDDIDDEDDVDNNGDADTENGDFVEDDGDNVEVDSDDDGDDGDDGDDVEVGSNDDGDDVEVGSEDDGDDVDDDGGIAEDDRDGVEDDSHDDGDDVEDGGDYVEDGKDDVEDDGDIVQDLRRKRRLSADDSNKLGKRQRCIDGCAIC